jgi:hypothetical protein
MSNVTAHGSGVDAAAQGLDEKKIDGATALLMCLHRQMKEPARARRLPTGAYGQSENPCHHVRWFFRETMAASPIMNRPPRVSTSTPARCRIVNPAAAPHGLGRGGRAAVDRELITSLSTNVFRKPRWARSRRSITVCIVCSATRPDDDHVGCSRP